MSAAPRVEHPERRIRVAEIAVATAGVITTVGLGSCVAISLYDAAAGVGALGHVLLPDRALSRHRDNPGRFAETAIPAMVDAIEQHGGRRANLVAKMAGGASMFASLLATSGMNVGARNVQGTREALDAARIPLVAEDTGGEHGRSVVFHVSDGALEVRSLRGGTRVL